MVNLSLDAFEKVSFNGKIYKKVDSFKKEKEAEKFAEELESSVCRSKRFPPVIKKLRIGLRLGFRYQVYVPLDCEVD